MAPSEAEVLCAGLGALIPAIGLQRQRPHCSVDLSFAALRPVGFLADGGALKSGEQLCRACGLCCDGTLFDLVKLERGDDAGKLKALGLPVSISRGQTPAARFPQPCSALCRDRSCLLYAERPWQCRTFECRLFKDAKAGLIGFAAALPLVQQARRRADSVRRLLRQLGDSDEHRAVGERFHRTSERLESGNASEAAKAKFADLSLAVHRLKLLLHNRFYTQNEVRSDANDPSHEPAKTHSQRDGFGKTQGQDRRSRVK